MKPGIHPTYEPAKITCACGRVTETYSTVGEIHVEICSHCHPFFTGRQKLVDTAGRVERFKAKYGRRDDIPAGSDESEGAGAGAAPAPEVTPVAEDAPAAESAPAAEDASADDAVTGSGASPHGEGEASAEGAAEESTADS